MKTITLEDDEFNAVCDLLQLLCVVKIRLYMQGSSYPNMQVLEAAWDKFAMHGMPEQPAQEIQT